MHLRPRAPVADYAISESDGVIEVGTSIFLQSRLADLHQTTGHGPWKLLAAQDRSY